MGNEHARHDQRRNAWGNRMRLTSGAERQYKDKGKDV